MRPQPFSTPMELVSYLDRFIVGQAAAKSALACADWHRNHRATLPTKLSASIGPNQPVLLLGPTGSGKTYLIETLAKHLSVPLVVADATKFSSTGLVGQSVEEMVIQLAQSSSSQEAERGIIVIDEFDKLANTVTCRNGTNIGQEVQASLLKLVEGGSVHFGKEEPQEVKTQGILWVFAGAFEGIESHYAEPPSAAPSELNNQPEGGSPNLGAALKSYGVRPELLGRITNIVRLSPLSVDSLVELLSNKEESPLEELRNLYATLDISLEFRGPETLRTIAKLAHKLEFGARGLRAILSEALLTRNIHMHPAELARRGIHKVVVTPEVFLDCADPEVSKEPSVNASKRHQEYLRARIQAAKEKQPWKRITSKARHWWRVYERANTQCVVERTLSELQLVPGATIEHLYLASHFCDVPDLQTLLSLLPVALRKADLQAEECPPTVVLPFAQPRREWSQ